MLSPATGQRWELWLTPGRFALVLGLLILAIHADVVTGSRSFFYRDYGMFGFPLAHYHRASFWQGEIPLWNPLNNCGLPFVAQWNTLVFYPLSLIYLLLPLPWGLNYFCLGHLFLAGLAMYFLAFRWTRSRLGAGVAGIGYALNGLTLHSLMWPNNIAALAWLPLVVLLVERAWKEGGRRILTAAVVAAAQMLSGAPEIILFTWVLLAGFWGGDLILAWRRSRPAEAAFRRSIALALASVRRFVGLVFIVVGLAAIQLGPFVDLLLHSHRDNSFGQSAWPMPGWGWANFLVPLFHCSISIAGVYSQDEQQWTSSYYLGIGILALALLAAWSCRRWRCGFLVGATLCSVVMALGENGHLFSWIKQMFPAVGLARFPIKFVAVASFTLPLLAAFGVRAACEAKHRISFAIICGALLVLIGGVTWFAQAFPWPNENLRAVLYNAAGRAGLLCVLFILLARWHWLTPRLPAWSLVCGLLLIPGVDALTHMPRQNPTVANWVYDPELQLPSLRPVPGQSRAMVSGEFQAFLEHASTPDAADYCLGHRRALLANWNLLSGDAVVNGFYSLYTREQWQTWAMLCSRRDPLPAPFADYVGVSQISSDAELFGWNPRLTSLPIITAGQRPVFASPEETLAALKDPAFNPRTTIYLPVAAQEIVTVDRPSAARILGSRIGTDVVEIEVVAERPSLVSIAQTAYHPWRARVDGSPARIWTANHSFQAVEVPAGSHRVELAYVDNTFRLGAAISVLTLIAIGVAAWIAGRWHPTAQTGGSA